MFRLYVTIPSRILSLIVLSPFLSRFQTPLIFTVLSFFFSTYLVFDNLSISSSLILIFLFLFLDEQFLKFFKNIFFCTFIPGNYHVSVHGTVSLKKTFDENTQKLNNFDTHYFGEFFSKMIISKKKKTFNVLGSLFVPRL